VKAAPVVTTVQTDPRLPKIKIDVMQEIEGSVFQRGGRKAGFFGDAAGLTSPPQAGSPQHSTGTGGPASPADGLPSAGSAASRQRRDSDQYGSHSRRGTIAVKETLFDDILDAFARPVAAAGKGKPGPGGIAGPKPGVAANPMAALALALPPAPLAIDPKTQQNVNISLSKLGKPPYARIAQALLLGNVEVLGGHELISVMAGLPPELLAPGQVTSMAAWQKTVLAAVAASQLAAGAASPSSPPPPTDAPAGDTTALGAAGIKLAPSERFVLEVVAVVPQLRARLAVLQFVGLFSEMDDALQAGLRDLAAACTELQQSEKLRSFLVNVLVPLTHRLQHRPTPAAATSAAASATSAAAPTISGVRIHALPQLAITKGATGVTLLDYITTKLTADGSEILALDTELPHLKDIVKAPSVAEIGVEVAKLRKSFDIAQGDLKKVEAGAAAAAPAAGAGAGAGAPASVQPFIDAVQPQLAAAETRLAALDALLAQAEAAFVATCRYFGEEPVVKMSPAFFAVFADFSLAFRRSARKSAEEADRAAKAAARKNAASKGPGAGKGGGNPLARLSVGKATQPGPASPEAAQAQLNQAIGSDLSAALRKRGRSSSHKTLSAVADAAAAAESTASAPAALAPADPARQPVGPGRFSLTPSSLGLPSGVAGRDEPASAGVAGPGMLSPSVPAPDAPPPSPGGAPRIPIVLTHVDAPEAKETSPRTLVRPPSGRNLLSPIDRDTSAGTITPVSPELSAHGGPYLAPGASPQRGSPGSSGSGHEGIVSPSSGRRPAGGHHPSGRPPRLPQPPAGLPPLPPPAASQRPQEAGALGLLVSTDGPSEPATAAGAPDAGASALPSRPALARPGSHRRLLTQSVRMAPLPEADESSPANDASPTQEMIDNEARAGAGGTSVAANSHGTAHSPARPAVLSSRSVAAASKLADIAAAAADDVAAAAGGGLASPVTGADAFTGLADDDDAGGSGVDDAIVPAVGLGHKVSAWDRMSKASVRLTRAASSAGLDSVAEAAWIIS